VKIDATLWKERAPVVAAALVFFLANLVYFLGGHAVNASRAEALARARRSARDRMDAAEKARAKAAADLAHIENVRKASEEFYGKRIGTIDDTVAAVVDEIHKVCRQANVNPHSITYGVHDRAQMPLKEMSIGFAVEGDYRTLRALLRGFESDPRWLVVRGVQLSRKGETTGAGTVHLALATYFYSAAAEPGESVEKARTTR
jgi:Tfp pilus assembly protein PilO